MGQPSPPALPNAAPANSPDVNIPNTYTFRWGEGQISGFLSAACGVLGLLAVLCYHFPGVLTFRDLNAAYDANLLRQILSGGLIAALILGLVNFCIGNWRTLGAIGIGAACIALLLGGGTVRTDGSTAFSAIPFGLDWFILDLLASAALFIPLERWFALRREQAILRDAWRLDLAYFAIVHLLVSVIILASTGTVMGLFSWTVGSPVQGFISSLPGWVQFPLVLLVADLAQYWSHRLMHTVPFFWRIHAIHHSAESMDWLASSRLHLGEVLMTRTLVLLPIFVLGFSQSVVMVYVVYIGLHAIFIHANVRFTLGPIRHLLVTPAFHHWHHSEDPRAANTNFAVHLPWLDRLFGTRCAVPGWPASYGIAPERLPEGLLRQFAYPLTGGRQTTGNSRSNDS